MASVRVYIKDDYITKNGDAPVYASLYIHREKIELSCKISVPVAAWDSRKCKVTTKLKSHSDHKKRQWFKNKTIGVFLCFVVFGDF